MTVRWGDRLSSTDPRRTTYDECAAVAELLLRELCDYLAYPANRELLNAFLGRSVIPYELPIDYARTDGQLHTPGNVIWLFDDAEVARAIRLRNAILDVDIVGDAAQAIATVLDNKIKVKAYLTDRALTGEFKTNREKRWETAARSHQFALRRDCMGIERALLERVARMDGFPITAGDRLRDAGLLEDRETTRCPITLDKLQYGALAAEVLNPVHGKSRFHVGHLNPLKAGGREGEARHVPENVSWISEDGNRIQGSLSMAEVRSLLDRIAKNYADSAQ